MKKKKNESQKKMIQNIKLFDFIVYILQLHIVIFRMILNFIFSMNLYYENLILK